MVHEVHDEVRDIRRLVALTRQVSDVPTVTEQINTCGVRLLHAGPCPANRPRDGGSRITRAAEDFRQFGWL